MTASPPPLILFSGMGADDRVFRPQLDAIPNLSVPRWISPLVDEPLTGYAARLANAIDPGRPLWIGGASFGGMVALEVARRLPNVLGCLLIGSVRSPRELPARLRLLRPATRVSHRLPFEWLPSVASAFARFSRPFCAPATAAFFEQAANADAAFLRWACQAVMTWEEDAGSLRFPVRQIHGDQDRILPWRLTRPDVLVRGGGHVLSLSHPTQVNDFLRAGMT